LVCNRQHHHHNNNNCNNNNNNYYYYYYYYYYYTVITPSFFIIIAIAFRVITIAFLSLICDVLPLGVLKTAYYYYSLHVTFCDPTCDTDTFK